MNKDIILEAEFFLSSFFWGMVLLFTYDAIRILRCVKHHIWAAVAIEDCLFWGIAGIFVFHMVYEKNHGIIRGFAAGGMALGMWFYLKLFSRRYVEGTVKLIQKAERGISRFIVFVTKPLRMIYVKIDKRLYKVSLYLKGKINKYIEKRKSRLKSSYDHYKIERDIKKTKRLKEKQMNPKKQKNNKHADKKEDVKKTMGVLEKINSNTY